MNHLQIAADMISNTIGGDPGLLNYRLVAKLNRVYDLAMRNGSTLRSRQVIATIIEQFEHDNPDSVLYSKDGE